MNIHNFKWKKTLIILIMPILLIILTVNTVSMAVNTKDSDTKIKQSVTDIEAYKDLILIHNNKESDDFTSSIISPKTHIEIVDKDITDWIDKTEKQFNKKVKKNKKNYSDGYKANLNINTEVVEVTENIVTFVFNHSEIVNNENKEQTIESFVVDLNQEEIIDANNFNPFLKKSDLLYKLIEESLKKEDIYNQVDQKKLKNTLKTNKELTWSLNKTNFRLHFDKNEIGSKINDPLTINIPFTELDGFIDQQLAEQLNIKELVQIAKEKEQKRKDEIQKKKDEEKRKEEEKKLEEQKQKEREDNLKQLDENEKYIALTFDDGPKKEVTPRILDYLDQYDAVATFYMLGNQAKANPKIAQDVANRGHEIASHSFTHTDLSTISAENVNTEVTDAILAIENATGIRPETFRPPYGAINQNVFDVARNYNQPLILWSVDSLDWKNPNANAIYSKVMNEIHPGAIVLMHDIHPTTADALPNILQDLKQQGYKFVTVTDLLQLTGNEDVGPYNSKK